VVNKDTLVLLGKPEEDCFTTNDTNRTNDRPHIITIVGLDFFPIRSIRVIRGKQ
jgi:hypothetical protein